MKNRLMWMVVWAMASVSAAACDDGDDGGSSGDALEIVGEYTDAWGSSYTITEESVVVVFPSMEPGDDPITVTADVLGWDPDFEYLVVDNGDGTFGRYDWTYVGDDLYYCQIEYAAASREAAAANDSADRGDPATSGCGDFSWSLLTPVE